MHIVAARQTFTGRPLEVLTSVRETDRLERDLHERLQLDELPWQSDPELTLMPSVAKRMHRKSRQASWFAADLNAAMWAMRPTTIEDLDQAFEIQKSPWRVALDPDRTDRLVPTNSYTGRSLNPKFAGAAFSSQLILKRLSFAAHLRALGLALFLARVSELVCNHFNLNQQRR